MDGRRFHHFTRPGRSAALLPEPPPSLAEYDAIPLAREPADPREARAFYSHEAAEKAERLLARIARAKHEAEAEPPPRFVG